MADLLPLWEPDPQVAAHSAIGDFMRTVAAEHHIRLDNYHDLWTWSVENLGEFWSTVWRKNNVGGTPPPSPALASAVMPGAQWFPGARLNYVDEVFRDRNPASTAVLDACEGGAARPLSWGELRRRVGSLSATFSALGVRTGDRVVGYLPNSSDAITAFLATASLGAVWSGCGPDYSGSAAADRMAQLSPTVLVAADGYHFNGRGHDRRSEAVRLLRMLPTVIAVVHVAHLGLPEPDYGVPSLPFEEACAQNNDLEPQAVAFDHPLWVLFSSGTTGTPKGLVHGHGGVILEMLKTNRLHLDLTAADRLFWYTSTNWMMWNFAVSALLVGASVVAYDGSPSYPTSDKLWAVAADLGVTVLGTSPGYLQLSQRQDDRPEAEHDLHALRLVGATGSPVPAAASYWVHERFGGRVPLLSMSGGTDLVAALATGAPNLPIWPGEMSAAALGVALDAYDKAGDAVRNKVGEMVITRPMPSMPVGLWNDPDGRRYRETYFSESPGVWRHGDWITISGRGTVVIHGRSDATLNRQGVRLGSADIYAIVEALPEVTEALVVGVELPEGRYWMPLFVVLDGDAVLNDELSLKISDALRTGASPRHVPDEVLQISAVPHTRTGKKLEIPVKRLLYGSPLESVVSLSAVDEPSSLTCFTELAADRAAFLRGGRV